jgi:hypothetical protein
VLHARVHPEADIAPNGHGRQSDRDGRYTSLGCAARADVLIVAPEPTPGCARADDGHVGVLQFGHWRGRHDGGCQQPARDAQEGGCKVLRRARCRGLTMCLRDESYNVTVS